MMLVVKVQQLVDAEGTFGIVLGELQSAVIVLVLMDCPLFVLLSSSFKILYFFPSSLYPIEISQKVTKEKQSIFTLRCWNLFKKWKITQKTLKIVASTCLIDWLLGYSLLAMFIGADILQLWKWNMKCILIRIRTKTSSKENKIK